MPINKQHLARLRLGISRLQTSLKEEQQFLDLKKKMIQLGQDKRALTLVDDLESNPKLLDDAVKNPRKVIKSRGLDLPRDWQISITKGTVNIHIGGSAGGHSAEIGYETGARGFYMAVDGEDVC